MLRARDAYLNALSPADLSIWLHRTDESATVAMMADFLTANVRPWDEPARTRVSAMLARVTPRLAPLARWLPHRILIVAVTPEASDNSDFTRGAAIFLKQPMPPTDAELDERFLHETFHILSRANPRRRDALYGVIGFVRCTPMALPVALRARLLTNPDAPLIEHAAPISAADPTLLATPLLVADPTRYDPAHPRFFEYLHVQITPLRRGRSGQCAPADGATQTQPQMLDALLAHAGRNTGYVLHPEEIMADNFAQMMMGRTGAPNPEVYDRLAAVLGITRP